MKFQLENFDLEVEKIVKSQKIRDHIFKLKQFCWQSKKHLLRNPVHFYSNAKREILKLNFIFVTYSHPLA